MLTEREVHTDLRALLMANEPFQYAHLIKFERPSRPDVLSGKVSTSAHRYVYLTDASRDVDFNDGSTNLTGAANGTQTYIANKTLQVSSVSESIEAKANNFSITLDANGIGAVATSAAITITNVDATTWDIAGFEDLIHYGFREGDKITLSGARTGSFNIFKFRDSNVLRIKKIEDDLTVGSGLSLTISLSSEEIKSILLNKNASDYASFINREVYIYRAYFVDGAMIGETPDVNGIKGPILLFKGIISNVNFDDEDTGTTVQWGLTSHWGDFDQVRGRITSDEFHRALDQNGIPQPDSAIKNAYAYDKGFMHSDTSINILATYSVQVEKQDIKTKSGFLGLGIGAKVKVKKYYVSEGRNTNLDFQLAAKAIPVIYGVRNVEGIPIFADTLKNDSSTVYVVYALSEGQVGGIYDVIINGGSLICNDLADYDARHKQTTDNTVSVICRGRADRGDVLGGVTAKNTVAPPVDYYQDIPEVYGELGYNLSYLTHYQPPIAVVPEAVVDNVGAGIIDGEVISLTSPQEITLTFYSGTESQVADSELVSISQANNFKVQNDYWITNDTSEYWGPNHRLLDTAYVVGKYKIKEGDTTIPVISFVLRGKTLDCYNYDYSYAPKIGATQNAANFPLGSMVALKKTSDNSVLNASVQIIDKWSFVRPDGFVETRFRFSETPALGYSTSGIPSTTAFYMESGGNTWHMTTFNHIEFSGTLATTLATPVSGTVDAGGNLGLTVPPSVPWLGIGGDPGQGGPGVTLLDDNFIRVSAPIIGDAVMLGELSGTTYTTRYSYSLSEAI